MNRRTIGKHGEQLAIQHLKTNGYKIIETNWTCHWGEIDVIAQDKTELVFIEVKYRKTNQFGYPHESFTKKKKDSLLKAIFNYLQAYSQNTKWRLDLITIIKEPELELNHYKSVEV